MDTVTQYLQDIDLHPGLTPDEKRTLPSRIRSGCQRSRQRYIAANLRLVVHVVARYCGSLRCPRALDFIQAGNLGLMEAVDRYDPERSAFSTYATWWIRQRIQVEERRHSRTIRLSSSVYNTLGRLRKDCIANPLCTDRASAYERYYDSLPQTITLTSPDCDESSGEGVPDEFSVVSEHPGTKIDAADEKCILRLAMAILNPRELLIIEHRFGLNNRPIRTLDHLGAELRVTRERIRQIQTSAIRKLRRAMTESRREGLIEE